MSKRSVLNIKFAPKRRVLFLLLLWPLAFLAAQGNADGVNPVSFISLTLDELIKNFGVPRSVYAARGFEKWQDDVVFVYDEGDFYVFKNRVWQVGLKSFRGINVGDSRGVVSLVLGSKAEDRPNAVFLPLTEAAWPMMLRCDFDNAGKVGDIFIYRTDF